MLFAAGKGTRLKPLTDHHPKCLVQAGGKTLLEHNLRYLQKAGVDTVVVNVHHLGQQVIDFIEQQDQGLDIHISVEEDLLETGGGLLKAAEHFRGEDFFLVCNSDIYTDLNIQSMINTHQKNDNLATLAVTQRVTSRYLRFNKDLLLCGWENQKTGETISWIKQDYQTLAFQGVQVISPGIFDFMDNRGPAFSTIPVYLDAARAGQRVQAFPMGDAFWVDIGTVEKLELLREYLTH